MRKRFPLALNGTVELQERCIDRAGRGAGSGMEIKAQTDAPFNLPKKELILSARAA